MVLMRYVLTIIIPIIITNIITTRRIENTSKSLDLLSWMIHKNQTQKNRHYITRTRSTKDSNKGRDYKI